MGDETEALAQKNRELESALAELRQTRDKLRSAVGDCRRMETVTQDALQKLELSNEELKQAQTRLVQSEKMASLGTLVAGIAHEINTPVGAVGSMHHTLRRAIEKLRASMDTELPANQERLFTMIGDANKVIDSGVTRVTDIVRRLRSFARLDEAALKEVDIHEGIEDTLTIVHHQLKHCATVTKNFGAIPVVSCFPGQLNQVFLNLLINAAQSIESKGVISITTFVKEGNLHVAIEDNGRGIAAENLKRIFDPGFTTKGVGVGTGIGLSICCQIMKEHQGTITVSSEVGKGSVFTVVFPVDLDKRLATESPPVDKKR